MMPVFRGFLASYGARVEGCCEKSGQVFLMKGEREAKKRLCSSSLCIVSLDARELTAAADWVSGDVARILCMRPEGLRIQEPSQYQRWAFPILLASSLSGERGNTFSQDGT